MRVQHGMVMGVCEVGVCYRGAMLLKDVLSKRIRVLNLKAANAIVRLRVHRLAIHVVVFRQRAHSHDRIGLVCNARPHMTILMSGIVVLQDMVGENELRGDIPHLPREEAGIAI